ncbi:Organic solvent tolerance protein [alpha proteobacterium HIMB59]|nr:Organic solvent tolerance protein [alpha proteobacterium HIMB59]
MNKKNLIIFLIFIFLFKQVIRLNANDDTYINSNNIIYDQEKNIVELADNTKINTNDVNILIDRGIIDYTNDQFEVFGNFYLYEKLNILSGTDLSGDTKLNNFSANKVSYIYNNDLKIDSQKLLKDTEKLIFYDNFLTPCELEGFFDCPTWSLRIDETHYEIEKDKFTHFDSFLQIADYKIFYLPYFTHYGVKADRQKGFLTPSIEYSIGGDLGIISPYYIPLNESSDITFNPKVYLNENLEFSEKYELNSVIRNKSAGGDTAIVIDNIKNSGNSNLNSSLKFETKQILDIDKVLSARGLFTNSISATRSINNEPITFEDIYLRFENYNIISENDYFKTEISSVESFETTNNRDIPISPNISYLNKANIKNGFLINGFDFTILKSDESTNLKPSESLKLDLNNELNKSNFFKNYIFYHKINFSNSYDEYYFNKDSNLNNSSFKSFFSFSTDIQGIKSSYLSPRIKFILPMQIIDNKNSINEDSNSVTFNYINQFSENRFFGNDLLDNIPRVVYAIENDFDLFDQNIELNVNQSYSLNSNGNYNDYINQDTNLSDIVIDAKISKNNLIFKIDTRLNQKDLSHKEMNYFISIQEPLNINLNYHETKKDAFKNLSNDTQALDFQIQKSITKNINLEYSNSLDVKNNYDPYKSKIIFSIFDECSKLDLTYSNTRFNDNFNTQPGETISFTFYMDYLGFFGYEQSTNLFIDE